MTRDDLDSLTLLQVVMKRGAGVILQRRGGAYHKIERRGVCLIVSGQGSRTVIVVVSSNKLSICARRHTVACVA
jgi:hypothetical protein